MKLLGVRGVLLLVSVAMPVLTACTVAPERSALVSETYEMRGRHGGSVRVLVSGGQEANLIDGIWISDVVFTDATQDAISKSGLFTEVVTGGDSDFRIEVLLQRLLRPTSGFGMDSQLSALWVLRALKPEKVLWQDLIVTPGAASVSDALSGLSRMRMAVERAARGNIQRAIQEMSVAAIAPADQK